MTGNKPHNHPNNQRRRALPFERKPRNMGEWSYAHKEAILITLIAYLIIGIIFVGGKIRINFDKTEGALLVEFPEEKLELTPEQVKMLEQMQMLEQYFDDFSDVSNVASNQNVDFGDAYGNLSSGLSDDKGTDAAEIYGDAGELDGQMRANREAYEAGLARQQAMVDAHRNRDRGADQNSGQNNNVKVKGRVTVSFSFTNPIRTSQKLVVPAYMCEGGGEITVIATLDTNGYVSGASIDRASSSPDQCMQETALKAARSSRFNLDTSAPDRHQGTITYMFIPQ